MFFNLIATFAMGFVVGGILFAVFRLFRLNAPRWVVPACAGLSMIAFGGWNEYTWYDRTASGLPDHILVAETIGTTSKFQPWTLVVPRIDRFIAVDTAKAKRHGERTNLVMTESILMDRYDGVLVLFTIFDCRAGRQAAVDPGLAFDSSGLPTNPEWTEVKGGAPILDAVCGSV
ncbi:MAG: hypothetical protein ACPGOV_17410 [Magnetovibrionaceae bacterium]